MPNDTVPSLYPRTGTIPSLRRFHPDGYKIELNEVASSEPLPQAWPGARAKEEREKTGEGDGRALAEKSLFFKGFRVASYDPASRCSMRAPANAVVAKDHVVEGGGANISTSTSSSNDRLQRATASDFDQRCKMTIGDTATETDVCLDCRPAEMPVEDRPGGLQTHSLVVAVEQLAQALDLRGATSAANRVRRPSGGFGLPPALPLVPRTQ